MHQIFGLIFVAALVVLLMRLPSKAVVAVLGCCAVLWLLAPGPFFGPLHFGHMHWPPMHFGFPPHLSSGLLVMALFVGVICVVLKCIGRTDKNRKCEKESN